MKKQTCLMAWCAVVASGSSAQGLSPALHPRDYCFLGAEASLPARPFNKSTGGCASNMIDVGKTPGRGGLVNNLAFYTMSNFDNQNALWRVSMILNINNTVEMKEARKSLAKSAAIISKKILGAEQAGLVVAIRQGKSAAWSTPQWRTEVIYSDWSTGLGHDIAVRFIPNGGQKDKQ